MTSYLYKPGHLLANKRGMVEKGDYYQYLYMITDDKRMMIGNQPVTIHYIADEMPATRHMCNAKIYTSKKKYRNETRAYGCVEVGNNFEGLKRTSNRYKKEREKKQRRHDVRRAVWELKNGRNIVNEVKDDYEKMRKSFAS